MHQFEQQLDQIFGKQAPKLPTEAKKVIVTYAPWGTLILGILMLWTAWTLWRWAHVADAAMDYLNRFSSMYGAVVPTPDRMSLWVWMGVFILAIEAVLYLLAFPGLKAHKKAGWNYLYYAALVNIAYAVINIFNGYGFGGLLGNAIGTAIGLWLLFQIRDSYTGEHRAATHSQK